MDMAPGAELYCIYIDDGLDMENAMIYIRNNGIQVANHSVGWVNNSYYDDTGPVSGMINDSHDNDGVFWAVSAGNDANRHWRGTWSDPDGKVDLVSKVVVPVTSVCPCSREISDYGAHNQRGEVRLSTRFKKFIWLEDMIELVEASASSDVYSVLKRVDEKCVTERAFSNPKFVEDIVRDIAKRLLADSNITWFSVSAENFESIHHHSAYAHITSG